MESGRVHDKKLADEYPLLLPVGSVLRQDLGFLGHHPPGVVVEMPHKKPPKGVLTFSQQLYKQMLSPLRGVIEHVHSGIKRLRMVQDKGRVRGDWFRDTVSRGLRTAQPARPQPAPSLHRARTREF